MQTLLHPVGGPLLLLGYFIPTITAFVRQHPKTEHIWIVNVCLGWTVVGWGLALLWAITPSRRGRTPGQVQRRSVVGAGRHVIHGARHSVSRRRRVVRGSRARRIMGASPRRRVSRSRHGDRSAGRYRASASDLSGRARGYRGHAAPRGLHSAGGHVGRSPSSRVALPDQQPIIEGPAQLAPNGALII